MRIRQNYMSTYHVVERKTQKLGERKKEIEKDENVGEWNIL